MKQEPSHYGSERECKVFRTFAGEPIALFDRNNQLLHVFPPSFTREQVFHVLHVMNNAFEEGRRFTERLDKPAEVAPGVPDFARLSL